MEDRWERVDEYLTTSLVQPDPVLSQVLENGRSAGLPPHNVTALQGAFLSLIVRMTRATRVLEIGTLAGYSTIWIARAMAAGGRVVTIEHNPEHAEVARRNFRLADIDGVVDLRTGRAVEILTRMIDDRNPPFEVIFIDADKESNPAYLDASMRLAKPGTVIIGDNIVRDGLIADSERTDPSVAGARRFLEMLGDDDRLVSTALQTVGSKGYDGFSISIVR